MKNVLQNKIINRSLQGAVYMTAGFLLGRVYKLEQQIKINQK